MTARAKRAYVEKLVEDMQAFLKVHGYRSAKGGFIKIPETHGDPVSLMVSIRLPFSGLCGAYLSEPGSVLKKSCVDILTNCEVLSSPSRKRKP